MEHISNEQKAKEIAQSVSFFWTNEDDSEKSIIDTVSLRKAIFNATLEAMEWKDEQHKQEKQQLIDEACKLMQHWILEHDYVDIIELENYLKQQMEDKL